MWSLLQPERINPELNQKGYNVKSDVWSLGITMVLSGLDSALAGLLGWEYVCVGSVGSTKHSYLSRRVSGSCRTPFLVVMMFSLYSVRSAFSL